MLINYLKLCFRILRRNPFLNVVNIVGLSVGFTVFFLLWQYSQNELASNQQYKDWERIVRFGLIWHWTDDNQTWNQSSFAMNRPEEVKLIAKDLPEIEDFTRIFKRENFTPEYQPDHGKDIYVSFIDENGEWRRFDEKNIVYADPNVFSFFNIPLIVGSPATCLKAVNSVVISQSVAKKFFGSENPVGKTLYIDNKIPFLVSGVFPDFSLHTSLDFQIAFSAASLEKSISQVVMSLGGCHSYFKLQPGVDRKSLEEKVSRTGVKYYYRTPGQEYRTRMELYLQPFRDVPFESHRWDYTKLKSKPLLYTLSFVAVVVLVMAWINYINLTLSAQGRRLKEIAVRKTIGSRVRQIVTQFVAESLVINLIAIFSALTFMQLIERPVRAYLNFEIPHLRDISGSSMIFIIMTISIGILINGIIPIVITLKKTPGRYFNCQGESTA
jgi:putative ABC transport system permease protein